MRGAILIFCAAVSSSSAARAQTLGDVAQQQAPSSGLSVARDALNRGDYPRAAEAAYAVVTESTELSAVDEATYLLAKALYRMEIFHGALHYFARILEAGPGNRFFASALEWCLFISRRVVDDARVNEVVAQYGSDQLPDAYRDEFLFRLARYHYTRALGIETGLIAGRSGKMQVTETKTGGISFSGDIFGADDPEVEVRDKPGRGLSISGDLFGGGDEPSDGSGAAAGGLTQVGHLAEAERYAVRVDAASEFGPRARFIEGLVLVMNDKGNAALDAFKDVVRATREPKTAVDERLRELAFFQLARSHFGAQQPSFSIFYYDRVERDSATWLDAIYEESWAQFRLGDYEKSLGNLLTLHSPFFESEYFPESRILEAVVYYENCRYEDADGILRRFLSGFEPVLAKLTDMTSEERSPSEYFELLDGLRAPGASVGQDAATVAQILELALADPDLARLDRAQEELVKERRSWVSSAGRASAVAVEVDAILQQELRNRREDAGRAVELRLTQERAHIKSLVQQAIRIQIETARGEQERIEARLRDVDAAPRELEKTFVEWADDEKLVWPFEGEYWRDELGTYELTLGRSCR